MEPITVLHLISSLSSGGAERQLANLICSTSREAVNHTVCTINDSGFFAQQIRDAGYEVIDLGIGQKRPFLRASVAFRRILKEKKPDIIHSWLYDANIAARLARLAHTKIPLVTSLQLADYEPDAARIGNWNPHKVKALKTIDRFTAWLTDPHFVACSKFVSESYIRYFGMRRDRAEVILNSFDPNFLRMSDRSLADLSNELGLPVDSFIYLNVGRLDPQKNQKTIIEAFRRVAEKIPNAYLLLVGKGSIESDLRKLAVDSGFGNRILFLGRRKDIGDLLELADVFVFPSFFEGLPVALIEAMFKRLPCIASNMEVFQEVIVNHETGLLVNPNSAEDLSGCMLNLHDDSNLRRRLGESAYMHSSSHFSVRVTAEKWEALYSKVAAYYRDS